MRLKSKMHGGKFGDGVALAEAALSWRMLFNAHPDSAVVVEVAAD